MDGLSYTECLKNHGAESLLSESETDSELSEFDENYYKNQPPIILNSCSPKIIVKANGRVVTETSKEEFRIQETQESELNKEAYVANVWPDNNTDWQTSLQISAHNTLSTSKLSIPKRKICISESYDIETKDLYNGIAETIDGRNKLIKNKKKFQVQKDCNTESDIDGNGIKIMDHENIDNKNEGCESNKRKKRKRRRRKFAKQENHDIKSDIDGNDIDPYGYLITVDTTGNEPRKIKKNFQVEDDNFIETDIDCIVNNTTDHDHIDIKNKRCESNKRSRRKRRGKFEKQENHDINSDIDLYDYITTVDTTGNEVRKFTKQFEVQDDNFIENDFDCNVNNTTGHEHIDFKNEGFESNKRKRGKRGRKKLAKQENHYTESGNDIEAIDFYCVIMVPFGGGHERRKNKIFQVQEDNFIEDDIDSIDLNTTGFENADIRNEGNVECGRECENYTKKLRKRRKKKLVKQEELVKKSDMDNIVTGILLYENGIEGINIEPIYHKNEDTQTEECKIFGNTPRIMEYKQFRRQNQIIESTNLSSNFILRTNYMNEQCDSSILRQSEEIVGSTVIVCDSWLVNEETKTKYLNESLTKNINLFYEKDLVKLEKTETKYSNDNFFYYIIEKCTSVVIEYLFYELINLC